VPRMGRGARRARAAALVGAWGEDELADFDVWDALTEFHANHSHPDCGKVRGRSLGRAAGDGSGRSAKRIADTELTDLDASHVVGERPLLFSAESTWAPRS